MKRIKIVFPLVLGFGLAIWGGSAFAGESVGTRNIINIGCHNGDGTCFVTLDGDAFGSTLGCAIASGKEFRFDNGDTAVGKRTYASLLAAFLSGKSISVYLDGCTSQGFSKLVYFRISG